jgi:DNA polymerase IV
MRWVLFLETVGFYARLLRRVHGVRDEKPVAVLREESIFDGCRLALSRGLKLGAPARQARRDCPDAALLDYGTAEYGAEGERWWNESLRFTPWVEPLSPHQVFLGLPVPGGAAPLRAAGAAGAQALPASLRAEIAALQAAAARYGDSVRAGLAPSRLLARAAVWQARTGAGPAVRSGAGAGPAAPAVVFPGEEARFLAPLPPEALWVAPPQLIRRAQQLGLRSVGELAAVPEPELIRQFGPAGRQLAAWALGTDPEPVRPLWPPREETERIAPGPAEPISDRESLQRAALTLVRQLSRRLAEKQEGCLKIALLLEREGEVPLVLERVLQKLQQDPYPLGQALLGLLQRAPEGPFTAVAARVSQIGPMPWKQTDLFDEIGGGRPSVRREQQERLERALLTLHERFPSRVVGIGPREETPRRETMLQLVDPYRWRAAQ